MLAGIAEGSVVNDDDSITIPASYRPNITDTARPRRPPPPPTPLKLSQLANAREVALKGRRERQLEKLEAKVSVLRRVLGGCTSSQMEKIASAMLEQEESLRAKQNAVTQACNGNLETIMEELRAIRRSLKVPPPADTTSSTSSNSYYTSRVRV